MRVRPVTVPSCMAFEAVRRISYLPTSCIPYNMPIWQTVSLLQKYCMFLIAIFDVGVC